MSPLARAAYACALGGMLLPALARKVGREGWQAVRLAQRLGRRVPAEAVGGIWLNFASVGELNAVAGLAAELARREPAAPLFATCSSEAAYALSASRLGVAAQVLPLDFAGVMARIYRALAPRLVILAEQELWPNMVAEAKRRKIPVVVVNGRLGAASARRHASWRSLSRELFAALSLVCAADRASARRFRALGAPRVVVCGNMKFDLKPDPAKVAAGAALRERLGADGGARPVVLLASTRADGGQSEEALLLDALAPQLSKLNLIVLPRHPHRVAAVAALLRERKLPFARFSELDAGAAPSCVLGDTMGQMATYIAAADVVFVGASLLDLGGQNPMEALAQGKPVVYGPHHANFAELAAAAAAAGALAVAADPAAAAAQLAALAEDPGRRERMGAAAARLAASYGGATARTLGQLEPLLAKIGPSPATDQT